MGRLLTASRKRWLVLCLLIAAAGMGGSLVHWQARTVAAEAGGPAMPNAAASAGPAAGPGAAAASASGGAAAPAAAVAAGGPALEEMPPIPPEGVEFCGIQHVPADELRRWVADRGWGRARAEELQKQVNDQAQRMAKAGVTRLAARLAAGSERQQVAARLLMRDPDGAALLAERSSDAQAYQMALSACGGRGGSTPSCARLNERRWAELDPTDARPWLRMVQTARQRKDAAGVDAALAQAAARPRLSRGGYLLEAQAVAVAEAVPDAAELGHALAAVIGFDAAMTNWDVIGLLRVCNAEGLREATRLGHCRTLARQVLANTTDLLDAQAAQRLADRTGVPREQQAHDEATLKAAQDSFSKRAAEDIGLDCTAMRRIRQLSTDRATAGDLGMALAMLPARQPAR
jgi:hypothetical protein